MSSQRSIASSLDGLVEALSTAKLSPERHNWRKLHSVENGGQVSEQPHTIAQIPVQPCVQDQPVAVAERGKTMQPSSPPDSTPVVGKQRTEGLRVLIVEDNEINRVLLDKRLRMSGHTVVNTMNGQECVELIEMDQAFDVVFMDIQMPILDGFQATRRIRETESKLKATNTSSSTFRLSNQLNGRIPVFAISASLQESQREMLMEHGMDGWILKPVDFKRLKVIISGVLDTNQRRADVYKSGCNWELGGWFAADTSSLRSIEESTS